MSNQQISRGQSYNSLSSSQNNNNMNINANMNQPGFNNADHSIVNRYNINQNAPVANSNDNFGSNSSAIKSHEMQKMNSLNSISDHHYLEGSQKF